MPVPRDMAVTPIGPHERMSEEDAAKSLAKTQKPRHEDNRGMDPAGGGTREQQP